MTRSGKSYGLGHEEPVPVPQRERPCRSCRYISPVGAMYDDGELLDTDLRGRSSEPVRSTATLTTAIMAHHHEPLEPERLHDGHPIARRARASSTARDRAWSAASELSPSTAPERRSGADDREAHSASAAGDCGATSAGSADTSCRGRSGGPFPPWRTPE